VSAEPGWRAILTNRDGRPTIVEVQAWGLAYGSMPLLRPLDELGQDLSARKNFVHIIDPNYPTPAMNLIITWCKEKAKKIDWIA